MKRLILIVAALAAMVPALVSCGAASKSGKDGKEIKVMSFNIRYGTAKDGDNAWDKRKVAVIEMLKDQNPAVFGVQEALPMQIDYICNKCPYYANVGVGRDDGKDKGEHMSVFYNKDVVELLDWGTYWLSETPDEPSYGWDAVCRRTATWTLLKVKATGQKFYFVNTHLDHKGAEAQKKGLALIVERIGAMNPKKLPMILTGDFNVSPDSPSLVDLDKIMKSARKYALDSDTTPSYNGWEKPKTVIDYVYYSGFAKCTDFKVVTKEYDGRKFVSDHCPVTAKLIF